MRKLILLVMATFVFVISCFAGSDFEDPKNKIAKNEKEIRSLKISPPIFWTEKAIKARIDKLAKENSVLIIKLKSMCPKEIRLKQIKIENARGYDGIWWGWADVRLRMNGKDITETQKDNNNPVFYLDIQLNAETGKSVIDVMDEDKGSFEGMGKIELKLNYSLNDGYKGETKSYTQKGGQGDKERGFEWSAEIKVTY